jgi:hypothetical protein
MKQLAALAAAATAANKLGLTFEHTAMMAGMIPGVLPRFRPLVQVLSKAEKAALPDALERLQKGFKIDDIKGVGLSALRKKQAVFPHSTQLFHGGRINWKALKEGEIIDMRGGSSWSTSESVSDSFRAMSEIGASKNSARISTNKLREAGIDPETFGIADSHGFRVATTPEELYTLSRVERISEQGRAARSLARIKQLKAEKKNLINSPYPSQEEGLFGLTRRSDLDVRNRWKQYQELNRQIRSESGNYSAAKQQIKRRREDMRNAYNSPVILETTAKAGIPNLPISELTGRGNYIKGMGAMDEFESILYNSQFRVVRKYVDDRGVKRVQLELVDAQKFSGGGMVGLPKYHTGGYVNYAYGKEVAAMLQGGEVVIPKEIVKSIQHGATNNSSVYNNTPNITVNVAGTNASPQEIANAVAQAMHRRDSMAGTRTVIR